MLNFIFGPAATGKTTATYKKIEDDVKAGKNNIILLVPEQNTFETERAMLDLFGGGFMSMVEVLSFTRLCEAAGQLYGGIAGFRVDDSKRAVFMGRALKSLSPHLNIFKKYVSSPSFIMQMTNVIKELKLAGIGSEALISVKDKVDNVALADKLFEISLIYSAYNDLLKGIYIDPLDDLEIFYQKAIDNDFFKDKTVYIDAFKGFTGIQLKILKLIINSAKDVTVTFCCEGIENPVDGSIFDNVVNTAKTLKDYADEHNIRVGETLLKTPYFSSKEIFALERMLSTGIDCNYSDSAPNITVGALDNPVREMEYVFKTIHRLVREENYKYGDFVLIARDISKYERRIELAAKKYEVPCYLDKRHNLMTSPVARFVLSLLKAANDFDTDSILSLIKTGFFGFNEEQINKLEEYVFIWDIKGSAWTDEWKMNPDGFNASDERNAEKRAEMLKSLNELRGKIVSTVFAVKNTFKSLNAEEISKAVFGTMISLKVDEKVRDFCKEQLKSYNEDNADFVMQSWDAVVDALDGIVRCYNGSDVTPEEYIEMLGISFNSTTIGRVPRMLDEVSCGSADRIRPARPKVVFAVGLNLSEFPKVSDDSGILLRSDRIILSENGIDISDNFKKKAIEENFLVYTSLCCATEKVFVLAHKCGYDGAKIETSPIFSQIEKSFALANKPNENSLPETVAEGFDTYAANKKGNSAITTSLKEIYDSLPQYAQRIKALDNIDLRVERRLSPEVCHKLFGDSLYLSPSKIEVYNKCPLSYFCGYVLRLKRLQKADLDSMQRGTIVHHVLEYVIKTLGNEFTTATDEVLEKLVDEALQDYISSIEGYEYLNTPYFAFIYGEIGRSTKYLIKYISKQFQNSDYVPSAFELDISDEGEIPSLVIKFANDKKAVLGGKIDRVDVYKAPDGSELVRVVDYKTGSKAFHLSDVYYGQNLQMLLYLYMLNSSEESKYKNMRPAGILYMPSKRGTVGISGGNPLMMNGMILDDEDNIRAMDKSGSGKFIFKKSATGRIDNPVISAEDFDVIFKFINKTLINTSKKIMEGNFDLAPLDGRDAQKGNACSYCDFKTVCAVEDDFEHKQIEAGYPDEIIEKMKEALNNDLD